MGQKTIKIYSTAARDGDVEWNVSTYTAVADGETGGVQVTPATPFVARAFLSFFTASRDVISAKLHFRTAQESATCPDLEIAVAADEIDPLGLGADGAEAEFLADYPTTVETIASEDVLPLTWYEVTVAPAAINERGFTDIRFRIVDDLSLGSAGGIGIYTAESAHAPYLELVVSDRIVEAVKELADGEDEHEVMPGANTVAVPAGTCLVETEVGAGTGTTQGGADEQGMT